MRRYVLVRFSERDEFDIPLDGLEPMPPQAARARLDAQFEANGCTVAQASGKVLTADKLLAIAAAVGAEGFRDAAFARDYARAAAGALDRPVITVDVAAMTTGY
ncbi:hypothetical protein MOJ79_00330 [Calidifontimicrobium sp. SYSU G02091]|uniref:hypothetical protein n=1 Tax=Calidifontimicrobium sp. SYSU G02091 TaxID=2926421 RepID=UPI001F5336EF|nr:hypothetical protein [Calidifontimicrobium sp. SYSU G02091]MCI1190285.1 hypothetical protein [Calidifontimicrobium sp. SYSU G02091]